MEDMASDELKAMVGFLNQYGQEITQLKLGLYENEAVSHEVFESLMSQVAAIGGLTKIDLVVE